MSLLSVWRFVIPQWWNVCFALFTLSPDVLITCAQADSNSRRQLLFPITHAAPSPCGHYRESTRHTPLCTRQTAKKYQKINSRWALNRLCHRAEASSSTFHSNHQHCCLVSTDIAGCGPQVRAQGGRLRGLGIGGECANLCISMS